MLKAYKYRLYPSEYQKQQMEQHFGCCRLIWNLALAVKKYAWESPSIRISRFDLSKQLTELKGEFRWLYDVNAQSLQAVLANLESAFQAFFKGEGFPKFKNKSSHQSFKCPQGIRIRSGYIKIPVIKEIRCENIEPIIGDVRQATIHKSASGKYYVSVLIDNHKSYPQKAPISQDTTIGFDLGIKNFGTTCRGQKFNPNNFLRTGLKRLKCLQRRFNRKKLGSKNKQKARLSVAILHERIQNQRTDYIHKITSSLVRDNQTNTIVKEDLNVLGMMKNGKLSRHIADASFYEFRRQLQYKCEWHGKNLIVIDRFAPSSKRCSNCGTINEALTLADREWTCACGTHHDRDYNAAKNIKHYGLEQISPVGSRSEPVESRRLRRAKKQEKRLNKSHYCQTGEQPLKSEG